MCGIVAVIGSREASPLLLEGLRNLEYRGYDSAGLATIKSLENSREGLLSCKKAKGKLVNLSKLVDDEGLEGNLGIGHTRWATHGKPETSNAHPHRDSSGKLAVVQNGIIENYLTHFVQLVKTFLHFLPDLFPLKPLSLAKLNGELPPYRFQR